MNVDIEDKLLKFDLDPRFGPSLGLSRHARWMSASKLGLNPDPKIIKYLENQSDTCILDQHLQRICNLYSVLVLATLIMLFVAHSGSQGFPYHLNKKKSNA